MDPSGTMGSAEEILSRYEVSGSGCTGLVVDKHGNLSSTFLHVREIITSSLVEQHCNY
jgi:hypothetical protein